VARWKAV